MKRSLLREWESLLLDFYRLQSEVILACSSIPASGSRHVTGKVRSTLTTDSVSERRLDPETRDWPHTLRRTGQDWSWISTSSIKFVRLGQLERWVTECNFIFKKHVITITFLWTNIEQSKYRTLNVECYKTF